MQRLGWIRVCAAVLASVAILAALWRLEGGKADLAISELVIGTSPATLYTPAAGPSGPAVVIAHGFAGSRQLMEPFAVTLARAGYSALAFDFRGHGRNPVPLTGDITREDGASRTLLAELDRMVGYAAALPGARGRAALLGHSMASDIVVRQAVADPRVPATIAVSMFSRAVTADAPKNLLIIVGGWENFLSQEALKAVALSAGEAEEAVTYGAFADGSARRAVFADNVEHVGVLYSAESLVEAVTWLDGVFDREGSSPAPDVRGPWVLLLIGGIVAMAWPLARLLPRTVEPPVGAGLGWRGLLVLAGIPALATPLILKFLPTEFLPVLVADYLAAHFALYGVLTALGILIIRRGPSIWRGMDAVLLAAAAVALWAVGALGWALDSYVASFWPHGGRITVIGALLAGILPFMLADEWLTRGAGARRGAYAITKLCLLASLALAVALDLERLFFLIIIFPVILLFFLLYGLISGWVMRATGQPAVAALANSLAFAWALGVTFPLVAG
ncbi:MAG: alpha/beta fold hydrolase [Pseudomonadota bacterium]